LKRQLESLKHLPDVVQGFRGFLGGAGEDQEIVCISDKPPVSLFDGLVQAVENDISDEWRNDAALRTSLSRDADNSVLTYSCLEEGLDESDYAPVGYLGADLGHHNLVVESVEEGGYIRINHMAETVLPVLNRGCDGVVSFAGRSKSETTGGEARLVDGGENLVYRLLAHAVSYSWYP